ncbi:Uncharacterised protein [Mycobacteroides abscessus subsp. abscessus]|nr:Uncharacterised protein [Mycobacteroides abscessus subsp. abscessus]
MNAELDSVGSALRQNLVNSARFCISARTASSTPGYLTLTATSRPSSRTAR